VSARPAPVYSELTRDFWTGGRNGELLIQRCRSCAQWQHPPKSMCTRCYGRDLGPAAASGRGTVWSFTVSRMGWGLEAPYVVADVELDDQPGLHLMATIVGSDDIEIGMRVVVDFEQVDDMWVPVFRREGA
jgi:uncharacterized OB-fold protein